MTGWLCWFSSWAWGKLLLLVATGRVFVDNLTRCLWTASWRGEPLPPWRRKAQRFLSDAERRLRLTSASFPPTLPRVQAMILKCNLELGSRRFNSAWMTLGVAVRLGQMMDLHREQSSADPVEAHYKRCAFWAMFVLDRYLAVLLGRPLAMHEGDITVALPTEVNAQIENEIGSWEKKLLTGVTAHTGLSRITGHAISLLYSGTGHNSNDIEEAVTMLEKEMDDWLQATPQFFHPNRDADTLPQSDFYDVPWTLQRQQRTVQAAFYFNQMLIYRGYLLGEFLRQSANIPLTDRHFERIRACVDSALATVMLTSSFGTDQSKYNAAFWTTSHILFCATSVLLVYLIMVPECADRPQIESSIEKAMKVHAKLVDSSNNAAQRLLEESRTRAEAIQKMSSVSPANASDTPLLDWATLNPELPNDASNSRSLFAQQQQRQDTAVPLSNASTSLARGSQTNTDVDKTMGNGQIPKQITELWGQQNLGLAPFGNTNDLDMILGLGFDSHMFSIGLGEDDVEYS
ncbi:hypothetical protein BHE90_009061 [Fusarium euwallaceae]|uniref:Xylanolytic transcriptional activator regulatory domain-containing protein n=1 Tax=Fusarium euwallaceae TaxID=1147111 RepID=A0A430LL83_9HYPO|nr:hypothetical protein BHE90_009061 [Fusarium euwallaceae]